MLDPEAFGTVAAICRYATRRTSSHARRTLSSAARRTRAEAAAARSGVDPHRIGGGSKRNASLSRRHRSHTASARLRARVLCSLTFELLGSRQLGSGSPAVAWAKDSEATLYTYTPTVLVRRAGARGSVPRAASRVDARGVSRGWAARGGPPPRSERGLGARPPRGERSASADPRPSRARAEHREIIALVFLVIPVTPGLGR